MDSLSDFRTAVQSGLNVGANSSLFTPTIVDRAINRSYIKCYRLYRFPQLKDAKLTTTQANVAYYDYPDGWQPDSAYRLTIDGDTNPYGDTPDFSPMVWEDWLDWKANSSNTSSTDKKWTTHGNQYFATPTPTVASLVISIWGYKNADALEDDDDETIFTGNMPECNEAVVNEAQAILKHKGEDNKGGQFFSVTAQQILTIAYSKLKEEKPKYEKENPMFQVKDMFGKASVTDQIGRFT